MRCPFCLNDVASFVEEVDASGRPVLVCPEPACREAGVPLLYAQHYADFPALPFSIVGLRGHGKTVFLTSLFHEFDDLGRRWPGFYWASLDEEGMREVRQRLADLRAGRLPEATNMVFPRAHILRLNNVPRAKGCHLMMFDTGGESFETVVGIMNYARYVKRSPAVVWLISLENLESPDQLDGFLTVYLQAQAEMKGDPRKQELIVVLTKGDLVLRNEKLPAMPAVARAFLEEHQLDPRGESWERLEELSDGLRTWLLEAGYHQFVNRAGDSFAAVRYCVVSAQGADAVDGGLELGLMPRGVLAPLFWLWRQAAPPIWVDTPAGRELFFSLEDALQESPPESTVYLAATTYRLKGPLQIRQSVRLQGRGAGKSIVAGSAEVYDVAFSAPGGRFEAADVAFHHSGPAAADVVRAVRGEIRFQRCAFVGAVAKSGVISGDGLALARDVAGEVAECDFSYNQGNGLILRDQAHVRVAHCQMRGNKASGIHCLSEAPCVLVQNVCGGNEAHGIRLGGATPARVEQNTCHGNKRNGIACADTSRPEVRKNDCQDNGLSGIQAKNEAAPLLEENRCQNNHASGIGFADEAAGVARRNECTRNAHCGVALADAAKPVVEENDCGKNGQHGIGSTATAAGAVRRNRCRFNEGCGISLDGLVTTAVEENDCSDNEGHGLAIGSMVGRIKQRGNVCQGNRGDPIKDFRKRGWFG